MNKEEKQKYVKEDGTVVMEFLVTFLTNLLKSHKTFKGVTYYKQVIVFLKISMGYKGRGYCWNTPSVKSVVT